MNNEFWKDKRVLVTGAAGFIGTNLVKELLKAGAFVVAVVKNENDCQISESLTRLGCDMTPEVVEFNLLDFNRLRAVADQYQVDTIFHLASSAILVDSANSPFESVENNIMTSLNVLELARLNKMPRVVLASSYKAYGEHGADQGVEPLPYKEDYGLRPLDIYSSTKASVDILARTYFYQFKVPVMVARPCNIFGEGDLNFTRLVPKTIMKLLNGEPPVINRGADAVLKEFIHIDDAVAAYILLAEKTTDYYGADFSQAPQDGLTAPSWPFFNIGSYDEGALADLKSCENIKAIPEMIDLMNQKLNKIKPIIKEQPENFKEVGSQYSDSGKIKALGFVAKAGLAEGLDRTVEWYKKYYTEFQELMHQEVK